MTVFNSLIPLTGALVAGSTIACHSFSTGYGSFINIAGGSGSEFYHWTDGTTTYTTPNVNNLHAGTWSVTVTDALTACQVFSVFTITQPPAMTLNIGASTLSVCLGGSIALTATNNGGTPGYTYQWTNGPPGNSVTVAETAAGTYVYSLTSHDSNTCIVTETVALDFVPNPTLSVASVSICPLETGTLTATGANNYTWSTGSNNASISDNPLVTTIYTVTGESLACTSSATASIILKTRHSCLFIATLPAVRAVRSILLPMLVVVLCGMDL